MNVIIGQLSSTREILDGANFDRKQTEGDAE